MTPPSTRSTARDENLVIRRELLDATGVGRALRRMAAEIVEKQGGVSELALVGIRTGGHHLAARLQRLLGELEPGTQVPLGAIDITLYRDDVFEGLVRPDVGPTELPFSLPGRTIVLVDDVLYTGRTIRAALDALMDYGRARAVKLAVLVDRGLRELPIAADHVGLLAPTVATESVKVLLTETGAPRDSVVVRARA